jgi:Uma2 family endonuclease
MIRMSTITPVLQKREVVYPESDGLPLSDNTKQFRWIMTIQGGLDAQYSDDPNVFVAGNLLWYPIEGDNKTRTAPDIFVAFGRPKGDRGSYRQWVEGGIAPQVTFEIVSPGNTAGVLTKKFDFYNRHGVEEYYLYDPDFGSLDGWLRKNGRLTEIARMNGWVSPLLGIRFDQAGDELRVLGPNGQAFVATAEAIRQRDELKIKQEQAEREKEQAEREKEQAEREKEQAQQSASEAQKMVEKLAAQLKALGVKPEA